MLQCIPAQAGQRTSAGLSIEPVSVDGCVLSIHSRVTSTNHAKGASAPFLLPNRSVHIVNGTGMLTT